MKKCLKLICIMIIFYLLSFNISFAAEGISLSISNNNVKVGDEFTVTVSQNFSNISAFEADLEYDSNVFELISNTASNGWVNLNGGKNNLISSIINSNSNVESEVNVLKFKVLAEPNQSEIKLKNIKVYNREAKLIETDNEKTISFSSNQNQNQEQGNESEDKKTLSMIEIKSVPSKVVYIEGEKFDPTGMEVIAKYTDGSTNTITNYSYPNDELKVEDKSVKISYAENNVTKEVEQSITVKAKSAENNELKGITLNYSKITLPLSIKAKMVLNVTQQPTTATLPEIVWTISDDKVAKLEKSNTNGSVTVVAASEGTAVVTAKTKDGKYSATCKVTVTKTGDVTANENKIDNSTNNKNNNINKNSASNVSNSTNPKNQVDNTTNANSLPKAGTTTVGVIVLGTILIIGMVVFYRKYNEFKGI